MAVTTWTPKAVVDLLPKYLEKRAAAFPEARRQATAAEAGVPASILGILSNASRLGVDVITVERHRWRAPYTVKDPWTPAWEQFVAAGLAERADGGWRVTARGRGIVDRIARELRAFVETLPLPAVELRRATKTLVELASKIPPDSERAQAGRRGLPLPHEVRSDVVRLEVAIAELSLRRDDCHIAAWQRAGYTGPVLDVLTQVWQGKRDVDEVAKAVAAKQERADVDRRVEELVRRGDLTRSRDALAITPQGKERREEIEAETDRRYFADWPRGDALARVGDDLTALLEALAS